MKALTLGVILMMASLVAPSRTVGQAPPASAKTDGPQARFSEMTFDFGKVRASDQPKHTFIVTNVGNALLEISSVTPGCGCTGAGEWDRKIQPGQTGKIPIQFNPASFNGRVTNKYISITCNDPKQPNHTLYLSATVWRPIDMQPAQVYFLPIEGETTNETKTVRIISDLSESVTLEPPQCESPAFKTELKTVQPGKEFELLVTYIPQPIPKASNAAPTGQITIKTSTTNMPELTISTYAMIQPALLAVPGQIRLPANSTPVGYRQTAAIRNRGSALVKLSELAVNAEGVKVEVVETQPGRLFTVNMDIPPNFEVHPGLELTAKTTHPNYPVFRVPLLPPSVSPPIFVKPPPTATNSARPSALNSTPPSALNSTPAPATKSK